MGSDCALPQCALSDRLSKLNAQVVKHCLTPEKLIYEYFYILDLKLDLYSFLFSFSGWKISGVFKNKLYPMHS